MSVVPFSSAGISRGARYAFVIPRCGASIGGGAETLVRIMAERLAARGTRVEIFTTCAKDNRTWANELPAGQSVEQGVRVSRFNVDQRNLDIWVPKQIAVSKGERLSPVEELDWMTESVNSRALYAHILKNRDNFDAFIFAPYLFGTTFWGAHLVPEKSFLIPCLHDEHYAYTSVMQSMFRSAAGCIFNALPEMELAERLFGGIPGGVVGMGFDSLSQEYRDSLKPYFADKFPYLVYLGRKETGKNAHILIDNFIAMKERAKSGGPVANLKLVIVGGGSFSDLERPEAALRSDIIDLPHVTEEEKSRILKGALALCQPSQNESFSIVMMESWLLGVPCLVSASSPVTLYHAKKSGGGLYFADSLEFSHTVEALFDQDLRARLGRNGMRYVESEYGWDSVLARFDQVFSNLLRL